MSMKRKNLEMIRKLMFRLLPIQILLAVVDSVNNIVSSFFASNFIGVDAMSAVGLYGPADMLLGALSAMMVGGTAVISGKYLGQNQIGKVKEVFSLNMFITFCIGAFFTIAFVFMGVTGLTGFFTNDPTLKPIFSRFLLGMSIGILPMILANQLPAFLTMENNSKRTMIASITYIVVNVVLNFLFVNVMKMQEFGLALATSLGMWSFFLVEAQHFVSKKSNFKFSFKGINFKEAISIVTTGFPGAAGNIYMTIRGLIVNKLLEIHVGSVGLSAFAAANNLLMVFWAIPAGMMAVSRLLISVSMGEEDRQTLTDIMRVMFTYYIPMICMIDALLIIGAPLLTSIFFQDTASEVFSLTAEALRILPLCMPFSIICMHFTAYGQASEKKAFVNILSLLDGVLDVALFSLLLTSTFKVNGVCMANVINGIITTLFIVGYSCFKNRYFPKNIDELMVIDDNFGVPYENRIDISVNSIDEVVNLSQRIIDFCKEKGIDDRRAFFCGLALEEMAGNIVEHGFTKDKKKHSINVRFSHKDDQIILRIKDDCIPFNPEERIRMSENDDVTKNIGIKMIYRMFKDIDYQYLLGMNVLTIKL